MKSNAKYPVQLMIVLAAIVVAVGGSVGFLSLGGALHTGKSQTIRALVPSAALLAPGARVTMAGAEVGSVKAVERRGSAALVTMNVTDDRVLPVAEDAQVAVRQRTPIGENYMDLVPGRSRTTLKSSAVLPVASASEYVDADQVLSMLQGKAKERTRKLFQGVGSAVDGRGKQLNETVSGVSDTFIPTTKVVKTLYDQRATLARLVDRLGSLSSLTAERGASIEQLGRDGAAAFQAVADRDDRIRELVQTLPGTLAAAKRTSGILDTTSENATPRVNNLAAAVDEVRPAVDALRPATQNGRSLLRELTPTAPKLSQTLDQVKAASTPVTDAIPGVRKLVCQINPMLKYTQPYTKDFAAFIIGFGSSTNSYDNVAHAIRLAPVFSENTLVGLPRETVESFHKLLRSGVLSQTVGPIDFDPFPKPNQVGANTSYDRGQNTILGPKELRESGFKYPRITPSC
ncbi:MlaD family protein [Patulibacter minatonensis]|uniref:MlaD family protein n=1 Tax=Patulibacter minatonensis TaxID=298163 RepID=UPI00047DAE9B|nr:MlaD family protein [Patulibacter minatonensis]